MRAVVWPGTGLPLQLSDLPEPRITAPGDVVIRVRAAVFGAALLRAVTVGHPKVAPPAVLGSLAAGEVVAAGDAVTHVGPGDLVTVDPHPPCGACSSCLDGAEALCSSAGRLDPGAHAELVRLPCLLARHARPVPANVSAEAAVLTELVACVLDGCREAAISPGQDVVVLGGGPIGLLFVQAARAAGVRTVVCVVNREERARLARQFGAHAVDACAPTAEADVLACLGGDGLGAHVVIEAIGRSDTYTQALRLVRPQGTVLAFGGCPPGTTIPVEPNALHYGRLRLIGSYHYRAGGFGDALAAIAEGRLDVAPLVSHRLDLEELVRFVPSASASDRLIVLVCPSLRSNAP